MSEDGFRQTFTKIELNENSPNKIISKYIDLDKKELEIIWKIYLEGIAENISNKREPRKCIEPIYYNVYGYSIINGELNRKSKSIIVCDNDIDYTVGQIERFIEFTNNMYNSKMKVNIRKERIEAFFYEYALASKDNNSLLDLTRMLILLKKRPIFSLHNDKILHYYILESGCYDLNAIVIGLFSENFETVRTGVNQFHYNCEKIIDKNTLEIVKDAFVKKYKDINKCVLWQDERKKRNCIINVEEMTEKIKQTGIKE
jgi:hypothetical protein